MGNVETTVSGAVSKSEDIVDEEVSDETLPDAAAGDETLPEEAVENKALPAESGEEDPDDPHI